MTEDEYIHERVDDQITWFDSKSSSHQRRFKGLRLLEITLAASIPFLSALASTLPDHWRTVPHVSTALFGMLITVIAGYLALQKFEETWIKYRVSAETLKREKFLFQTGSGPYAGPEAFHRFVERVEGILRTENENWMESARTPVEPGVL